MNPHSITLQTVTKKFSTNQHSLTLFSDISFSFTQHNSYAITGRSGIGKSTLLSLIAGIEKPTSGIITFDNTDLDQISDEKKISVRQEFIGILFQKPYLFSELSVLENILLPAHIAGKNPKNSRDYALYLLERFMLIGKYDISPALLSGGQQQRVALARALITRPYFLLADEPTAHLDQETAHELFGYIFQETKDHKIGLIITSHDQSIVNRIRTILTISNTLLSVNISSKVAPIEADFVRMEQ
jgi:ABC-type lipoprotein export system ATPase subunit